MSTRVLSLVALLSLVGCSACSSESDAGADGVAGLCEGDDADTTRPTHWTVASHCKGAEPDYDLLFDDSVVHRIDITISDVNYAATMADLDELLGGGGGPGGGPGGFSDEDPMWVPVTVEFNGGTWTEVGMRYKGNSSLVSAYREGVEKFAFRFNFDMFEDDNPELDDQRFHGFKKMTFSNGFNDPSLIRDKMAADLFRAHGVPAARTSFARIYMDAGEGSTYMGLYAMIEDPSNKLIDTQFADGTGNLYKPDGAYLDSFDESSFEKKTNEDEADFTDVQAFVAALNADRSDAAQWRSNLEATFDVSGFLAYLALNQSMMNWDTYGWMTHNFYLYADPSDGGRLVWIPWDMNESLIDRGTTGPWATAGSVLLDEATDQWPLIRYLLDDPVYAEAYRAELAGALSGAFDSDAVAAQAQNYHDLIAPYAAGSEGEAAPYSFLTSATAFEQSVSGQTGINAHVTTRHAAVQAALD